MVRTLRIADDDQGVVGSRLIALVTLVVAGTLVALLIARSASPFVPVSDIALTELYTREAVRADLLVGPYSRFGWHHPGPVYFYLLAPFYAAGGHDAAALSAGAFFLSLVAIAIVLWTSARYIGAGAAVAAVALLAAFVARVDQLPVSSWNAHAIVLPAAALIIVCAATASGASALLPVAAVLASFLIQTDIALLPFVVATVAVAVAMVARSGRLDHRAPGLTAAVAAVMWAIPIVEQTRHAPGNLTLLWQFFARAADDRPTMVDAVAIWSDALTAPFRPGLALANGTPIAPVVTLMPILLAAALVVGAVAAAMIANRRAMVAVSWLAVTSAVASLATLWSATRITGGISDHQTFWFAVVGLMDAASIAAAAVGPRVASARATRAILVGLLAVVLLIGVRQMDAIRRGRIPVTDTAPSAPNFATSIREYLARTRARRPLVRLDERQWGLGVAILLELDRAGVPFAVEESWMPMFPGNFRPNGSEDIELTFAARGASPELARRPGNETVDESTFIHVEAIALRR